MSVRQKIAELFLVKKDDEQLIGQINGYYYILTEEFVDKLPTPGPSYRYANDLKEKIKSFALQLLLSIMIHLKHC